MRREGRVERERIGDGRKGCRLAGEFSLRFLERWIVWGEGRLGEKEDSGGK